MPREKTHTKHQLKYIYHEKPKGLHDYLHMYGFQTQRIQIYAKLRIAHIMLQLCKDSRQDSGHSNFSNARYAEKLFPQIYRDLYGNAMLVPIRMGTNMAAGSNRNISH